MVRWGIVAAVASRDRTKAETLARECGAAHAFGSYDALLGSPLIEGGGPVFSLDQSVLNQQVTDAFFRAVGHGGLEPVRDGGPPTVRTPR